MRPTSTECCRNRSNEKNGGNRLPSVLRRRERSRSDRTRSHPRNMTAFRRDAILRGMPPCPEFAIRSVRAAMAGSSRNRFDQVRLRRFTVARQGQHPGQNAGRRREHGSAPDPAIEVHGPPQERRRQKEIGRGVGDSEASAGQGE